MNLHYNKSEVDASLLGIKRDTWSQRICEDWLELHRTVVELRAIVDKQSKDEAATAAGEINVD